MTDEELSNQLFLAANQVINRHPSDSPDIQGRCAIEFLCGIQIISQLMNAYDGEITSQQVSRAVSLVLKQLGLVAKAGTPAAPEEPTSK